MLKRRVFGIHLSAFHFGRDSDLVGLLRNFERRIDGRHWHEAPAPKLDPKNRPDKPACRPIFLAGKSLDSGRDRLRQVARGRTATLSALHLFNGDFFGHLGLWRSAKAAVDKVPHDFASRSSLLFREIVQLERCHERNRELYVLHGGSLRICLVQAWYPVGVENTDRLIGRRFSVRGCWIRIVKKQNAPGFIPDAFLDVGKKYTIIGPLRPAPLSE
jgi:hypothetical protein